MRLFLNCGRVVTDLTGFGGVAYSGEPFPYSDNMYVIDLSSTGFKQLVPVLLEHDKYKRIGAASLNNHGTHLSVSASLLENADANAIKCDAEKGFPFELSVGIFDLECQQVTKGECVVNGKPISAPITILKQGKVRELSLVTLGADSNTSTQFFSENEMDLYEDDKMGNTELELEIAELSKKLEEVTLELKQEQEKIKLLTIERGFDSVKWDYTLEAAQPFLGLSIGHIDKLFAHIKEKIPILPNELFMSQVTGGERKMSLSDINTQLFNQVKRV